MVGSGWKLALRLLPPGACWFFDPASVHRRVLKAFPFLRAAWDDAVCLWPGTWLPVGSLRRESVRGSEGMDGRHPHAIQPWAESLGLIRPRRLSPPNIPPIRTEHGIAGGARIHAPHFCR